jgi:hypothetical protein
MFSHEYFKLLSSLAAVGQLSAEENRELDNHLFACATCKVAHQDYAHVVQRELPHADDMRWRVKLRLPGPSASLEIRNHFLARARAEGFEFSPEVEQLQNPRPKSRPSFRWRPALVLTSAALLAVSTAWFVRTDHREPSALILASTPDWLQTQLDNDELRAQLAQLSQAIQAQRAQISRMNDTNLRSEATQQQLNRQLADAAVELERLNAALEMADPDKKDLVERDLQKNTAINGLLTQNDKLVTERDDLLAARTILEAQVRDLDTTLQHEESDLDREHQLSAVTSDVRQLMGARNLHLVDVHDVYGGEKKEKAFGRIFYAEGKALIFYAFDLPSRGATPGKYAFKAWGQREGGGIALRNLGTFEVDSQEQRRWVLKVDNSALLDGIDSIFVTAEPPTDATEPHGKRYLYAYIAGQANHP